MIGFVILNYKKWDETVKCIESIYSNPPKNKKFKLYIVDNCSPNQPSAEFIQILERDEIKFIKSNSNGGYAAGNNLGIKFAINDNCEYIVVSNSDIFFQEDSIDAFSDFYCKHKGICFPKVFNLEGIVSPVGSCYYTKSCEMYIAYTELKYLFKNKILLNIDSRNYVKTHLNIGPCFVMDLNSARKLYPFDENTVLYFEEMILSRKADELEIEIYYCPYSKVIHGEGKSTDISPFSKTCFGESMLYYMRRYIGMTKLQCLPMYIYLRFKFLIKVITNKSYKKYWKTHKQKLKKMINGNWL